MAIDCPRMVIVLRVHLKQPGVTATETNMYLAEAAEQIDTPYTSALIGMSLNGHADNAGNCQHGQITASKKLMIF